MTDEEKETQGSQEQIKGQEKTPATNPIEEANKAAERLEKANAVKQSLLDREEALVARRLLGGQSEAGQTRVKPKELTPQEYANKLQLGEVNPLKEDGFN